MICLGCRDDLDHCHGMLLIHADGMPECTEPGCLDLDRVRHVFVVVCDDSPGSACDCLLASVGARRRRRRAA